MIVNVVLFFGLITLGLMAESYRQSRNALYERAVSAENWVDEIIEALENQDEKKGNEEIDSLIAQRTDA